MTSRAQPDLEHQEQKVDAGLQLALSELLIAGGNAAQDAKAPLVAAIATVMKAAGHPLSPEKLRDMASEDLSADIEPLLRHAGIASRPVELAQDWWRHDGVPMLARLADGSPAALIPASRGGWRIVTRGANERATARNAGNVLATATQICPVLPDDPVGLMSLLGFGLRGTGKDVSRTLSMALLASLTVIALPIAAATLFEHVIPSGDYANLWQILIGLVALAFGQSAFELVRTFAVARIEARLDAKLQAAVFHRLLRLPATFFGRFSTGDLAERVLGLQEARQLMTGSMLSGLFGAIGMVASATVLFFTDWRLALIGLAAAGILAAVSAILSWRQLVEERRQIAARGLVQGFVLQLLFGILRLRSADAEKRGLTQWAWKGTKQRQAFMRARMYRTWQNVLQVSMPWLCLLLLYMAVLGLADRDQQQAALEALVAVSDDEAAERASLSVAAFAGFATAFGQLTSAMRAAIGAVSALMAIAPLVERTRPVLQAIPEEGAHQADKSLPLQGDIEFRNVSFRYNGDGPPVLKEVSFRVKRGAFVAIVGASGSGKSTLLRLMLGFETLESGEILYDGIPSHGMEPAFIRSQAGVVLQNGMLSAGSIYDNIVGSSGSRLAEVNEAVRLAGLENDIEAMPMGLHTILGDGAPTLSGGQRQRVLLARAIVRKPKILLLDEATSALDNRTQNAVATTLVGLDATRVVIAHRLSTIRGADHIVVLDKGRVVETGTYERLVRAGGSFQALAKEQNAAGRSKSGGIGENA